MSLFVTTGFALLVISLASSAAAPDAVGAASGQSSAVAETATNGINTVVKNIPVDTASGTKIVMEAAPVKTIEKNIASVKSIEKNIAPVKNIMDTATKDIPVKVSDNLNAGDQKAHKDGIINSIQHGPMISQHPKIQVKSFSNFLHPPSGFNMPSLATLFGQAVRKNSGSSGHCGNNEVYSECKSTCPKTCDNPDAGCNMVNKSCEKGCDCKENFYRNSDNKCVSWFSCKFDAMRMRKSRSTEKQCKENATYSECANACPSTCEHLNIDCRLIKIACRSGCRCNDGLVKDEHENCVRPEECKNV